MEQYHYCPDWKENSIVPYRKCCGKPPEGKVKPLLQSLKSYTKNILLLEKVMFTSNVPRNVVSTRGTKWGKDATTLGLVAKLLQGYNTPEQYYDLCLQLACSASHMCISSDCVKIVDYSEILSDSSLAIKSDSILLFIEHTPWRLIATADHLERLIRFWRYSRNRCRVHSFAQLTQFYNFSHILNFFRKCPLPSPNAAVHRCNYDSTLTMVHNLHMGCKTIHSCNTQEL